MTIHEHHSASANFEPLWEVAEAAFEMVPGEEAAFVMVAGTEAGS